MREESDYSGIEKVETISTGNFFSGIFTVKNRVVAREECGIKRVFS